MAIDGRELRNAVGLFATGVTIITTKDASGKPFGLTANAFSSLDILVLRWPALAHEQVKREAAQQHMILVELGRHQHPASDLHGVLDRFEARGVLSPIVTAEIVVAGAGRDDQCVVPNDAVRQQNLP